MSDFVLGLLVLYLSISVAVAVDRLLTIGRYERSTWNVPFGDLKDYYASRPRLFTFWTSVFFPATIIIMIWVGIVKIFNSIDLK